MLKPIAFALALFAAAPLWAQTVSQTRAQVPPSTAMQTNVSANANGVAVQVGGYSSVLIVVTASVAMSGGTTINFECQSNGTFGAVSALKMGTTTVATTTTAIGDFQIAVGSYQTCRARISAYSAGTMSVVGYPSVIAPAPFTITSAAGGGSAVTIVDGGAVALGTTTDAKSTATDATSVTLIQIAKEISAMEQAPASRAVTNAGTFAVQASQATGTNLHAVIDSGSTTAVTQATGTNLHAVLDTTSTTAVTQATATNLNAAVVGTGTAGSATGGVLTIQGVAAMTKLLVTPDAVALPANQSVNVAQVGGTNTVTAGVSGAQGVGGCVATNVAITCNPNLIAAQAVSSENAAATTARAVQLVADLVGKLIVMPYANPENNLDGTITTAMTGTTSTVFSGMGAQGGSVRVYVTACTVSNAHATVGTDVVLQDGSGGTTLWTLPAAPAYGGAHTVFPNPLKTTGNNALYAANVTTGASTKISCTGFKGI